MILIGLGANLPSPFHGEPRQTLEAALATFAEHGIELLRRSRWYRSAPMPPSSQPWYVNGVAVVRTALGPPALLAALNRIEAGCGRVRGSKNDRSTRVLRSTSHLFLLGCHPLDGRTVAAMIASLPEGNTAEPML